MESRSMQLCKFSIVLCAVLAAPLASAEVATQCQRPIRPAIPDGASASETQLVTARGKLEGYLEKANKYLTCLRRFEEELGAAVTEVDGHELVGKYNAMVDEMYLAGDEFNIALRRFTTAGSEGD